MSPATPMPAPFQRILNGYAPVETAMRPSTKPQVVHSGASVCGGAASLSPGDGAAKA